MINQLDMFITNNKKCVHTEHCCVQHGCKYGDEDCPVTNKQKLQSYECEDCLGIEYDDWFN